MISAGSQATYIASKLKAEDYPRYAATLFLDAKHRAAVQSIWAFSSEVSSIRERVRDAAPGEIRLQWWVDALSGAPHGQVNQNPIADALLHTIRSYNLPTGPLLRLVEARRYDLYSDPITDLNQFEGYAGEVNSILYQYACMIIDPEHAPAASNASGHIGVAQTMLGHVQAFAYNIQRKQVFLPISIFNAHGLNFTQVLALDNPEAINAALRQCLDIASQHLHDAKLEVKKLPRSLKPVFATLALLDKKQISLQKTLDYTQQPLPTSPAFFQLVSLLLWLAKNT